MLIYYVCVVLAHDGVSAVRFSWIVSLQLYGGVHVVHVEACVLLVIKTVSVAALTSVVDVCFSLIFWALTSVLS